MKNVKRLVALSLSLLLLAGVFPLSLFADDDTLLSKPVSVSMTTSEGKPFVSGQKLLVGEKFDICFSYGNIASWDIDTTVKYPLPLLDACLTLPSTGDGSTLVELPLTSDMDQQALGTLFYDKATGAMAFQFDERFEGNGIDGFYLRFNALLNDEGTEPGNTIDLSFPTKNGSADFSMLVVEEGKDPPTLKKEVALYDSSSTGNVELLWTITVNHAANPNTAISLRDTWSVNQEYADGSFCVNGTPVSTGLTVTETGFTYAMTGITASQVDKVTYRTRIKSSAFANKNGVPLSSGNIKCTNTAQAFAPGEGNVALSKAASATYNHPILWLHKVSDNVIDRRTGEMEWTITIYNNGMTMNAVTLYDRLSPGVSVKDSTVTVTVGNSAPVTYTDFQRLDGEDRTYTSGKTSNAYNLTYSLGDIGSVTTIVYRTIITDPDAYDATEHLPPDSIYDNLAFIDYSIIGAGGTSQKITSPVVEKAGGFDGGLIGKTGALETAYHTIKWTLTVNENGETLPGVTVTDTLTYADPVTKVPSKVQYCQHVYDDTVLRNKPQYSFDGETFYDFTLTDSQTAKTPFTYWLTPSENGDGNIYQIHFYLGDITQKVTIVFRSTATDEIIYANNVTSNNCVYENKTALTSTNQSFSYASAEVVYKSNVFQKNDARSWANARLDSYNFKENQFAWLLRVNTNKMEMKDICLTDTLSEGTSLVRGSLMVGSIDYWYNLAKRDDTLEIKEYAEGVEKPYYTYDDETRELKIWLDDITGSVIGTNDAIRQIVFYVQVDVEHRIFNDPTYPGYLGNADSSQWMINNSAKLENNYLDGADAPQDTASYIVYAQRLSKTGTTYRNKGVYSIDYSLFVNRLQQTLPKNAVLTDTIPVGLRLDASTIRVFEASVLSPDGDTVFIIQNGVNGSAIKGAELDTSLYSYDTVLNEDGTTTLKIALPENSGTKMYLVEYSCDVTDVTKAPFTNEAEIDGMNNSDANKTITKLELDAASGGGSLVGAEKTNVFVSKTDTLTGGPVAGAFFSIYYKGVLIETKKTDADGKLTFENLNRGLTYTVTETKAAPGYLPPENTSTTFKATAATDPIRLAFQNTAITDESILITKEVAGIGCETDRTFSFTLTLSDTTINGVYGDVEFTDGVATFTLCDSQQKVVRNLPVGTGYTVTETPVAGYTAFTNTARTETATGTVSATALSTVAFVNDTMIPAARVSLTGQKTLTGEGQTTADILAGQFTFTVTRLDTLTGAVSGIPAEVSTAAGGALDFGTWMFGAAGDYVFRISENDPGSSYTTAGPITVTVHVTLNRISGKLTATVDMDDAEGQPANLTFANVYTAPQTVKVPISGQKTLAGFGKTNDDILKDQFSFTVTPSTDNPASGVSGLPAAAVTTAAGGALDFGEWTFSTAGSYQFTISEQTPAAGYTKGSDVTVTVDVSLDDDNALTARVTYSSGDSLTISNTYTAPQTVSVPVSGTKTLTEGTADKAFADGQFSFLLTAGAENDTTGYQALATEKADVLKNGTFSFGSITFTRAGTYRFTVTEENNGAAGYVYDDAGVTITVTVSLNGTNNSLSVTELTYQKGGEAVNSISFANRYTAPTPGQVTVSGQKHLSGGGKTDASILEGQFSFTIAAAADNDTAGYTGFIPSTVSCTAGGAFSFGTISFVKEGTYRFTLGEVAGNVSGYTYDRRSLLLTVTVRLDPATNTLVAEALYSEDGQTLSELSFINTYSKPGVNGAPTAAALTLTGTKVVLGAGAPAEISAGQFTFTIRPAEGTDHAGYTGLTETAAVRRGGAISFGTLFFTKAGEYVFTVTENRLDAAGYTYDSAVYTVTVQVTLNTITNALGAWATIEKDGAPSEEIVFVNTYTDPVTPPAGKPEIIVGKTVDKATVNPGDTLVYTLTVKNIGTAAAFGVLVRDYMPSYTHYFGLLDDVGAYNVIDGREEITWFLSTVAPGETVTLSFRVTVDTCVPEGAHIRNTALYEVTGSATPPAPTDPMNPENPVLPSESVDTRLETSSTETTAPGRTTGSDEPGKPGRTTGSDEPGKPGLNTGDHLLQLVGASLLASLGGCACLLKRKKRTR